VFSLFCYPFPEASTHIYIGEGVHLNYVPSWATLTSQINILQTLQLVTDQADSDAQALDLKFISKEN
jgi:hypothetical protein